MVLEKLEMKRCMSIISLINSDLKRYSRGGNFLKCYITIPGFKYTVFLRLIQCTEKRRWLFPLTILLKVKLLLMQRHYGIQIPSATRIGKGFYIGHYGTIIVNAKAIIGDNVNISQGVTIRQANRGQHKGVPVIGNEVYIGPGAKIVGKVVIGNNVAIGANAVVTNDVPDNACVAGVPARIINMRGAEGYVNNKA